MPRKYAPRGISLAEKIDFYSVRDTATGCRLWQGSTIEDGYGRVWWNGRLWLVHRAIYDDVYGPISGDMKVCHTCDRPACSELTHLFIGTDADNNADMMAKGRNRQPRGVRQALAKLTDDQVRAIRSDRRSQTAIAAEYGVWQGTISAIKRRFTWKHVR
jgi:hypothetical protein